MGEDNRLTAAETALAGRTEEIDHLKRDLLRRASETSELRDLRLGCQVGKPERRQSYAIQHEECWEVVSQVQNAVALLSQAGGEELVSESMSSESDLGDT